MIYLDNGATTPLLPEVKQAMIAQMEKYGNPSSLYMIGAENKIALRNARTQVATLVGCNRNEIYFTSGASESNSWVFMQVFDYAQKHGLGNHIITSMIEHHSILEVCDYLHKYRGADITYLGVNKDGYVQSSTLQDAIRPRETCLVSIMASNNEVGSIQKIVSLADIAHKSGVLFHTDATQSLGKVNLEYITPNVDYMSASAHKISGPKGTGMLYAKKGTPLLPHIFGTQENGLRGGTENVIGIVGFGEACKQYYEHIYEWNQHVMELSGHMRDRVLDEIQGVRLNGRAFPRLVGNLNFSFDGVNGEELMTMLDMNGICVSTGSACNSSSGQPSHVLMALGLTKEQADSSIRISISHENTMKEIDYVVDVLKETVNELRRK